MAAIPNNSAVPTGGIEKGRRETIRASKVNAAAAVVPT